MGRLLREIMEDEEERFHQPTEEMIPELLLLGTLEHRELSLKNGKIVKMDIINYEGRNYAMKIEDGGKWFGTYEEMQTKGELYAEVRWR